MTEPGKMTDIAALDDLFAQVRAMEPVADTGLLARIMADAVQTDQARQTAAKGQAKAVRPAGWLAGFLTAVGGWPALGGLVMATGTGLWIGVAAPDSISAVAGAFWGDTVTVSLDSTETLFGLEG
jgi:outer membrane lipoprotein SlyB